MKTRKASSRSRRGFLARLAAVGTMLGGVIPELRAGTLMETPVAPPPPTPLPPAKSALLYSSALADAEVKMLLASAGPGASVMPPEHTYDMGGQGQGIALPVKNSSGRVTAYVIYLSSGNPGGSLQAGAAAIKLLLKDNGTASHALNGQTYPTPPEAAATIEFLYTSFFSEKVFNEQLTIEINKFNLARKRKSKPDLPPAAVKACERQFDLCKRAIEPDLHLAVAAHLAFTACLLGAALSGGAVTPACWAAWSLSTAAATTYGVLLERCRKKLNECLNAA